MTVSLGQWPYFDEAQISVATDVLRSGRVNAWTGGQTSAFEKEFATWCNTRHAVASVMALWPFHLLTYRSASELAMS